MIGTVHWFHDLAWGDWTEIAWVVLWIGVAVYIVLEDRWRHRRPRRTPNTQEPYRWERLAQYNAERHRGVQHTPKMAAAMLLEQWAFNAEQRQRRIDEGWIEIGDGWFMKADDIPTEDT